MDGLVKGVSVLDDESKKTMLQSKVWIWKKLNYIWTWRFQIQSLCKYTKNGFPGLQPVSLSQKNINLMEYEPYMVSWKADGMRYIVYIHDGEVYAFDRDNEVFEIENLAFVTKDGSPMMETLVDTEVIIDKTEVNGVMVDRARMLIYDIMRFNVSFSFFYFGDYYFQGVNVMKEKFSKRFEIIKHEIIDRRNAAFQTGRLRYEDQIMSVRRKDFWPLDVTYKLFENEFVKHVGHEIDGLIFQPQRKVRLLWKI